MSDEKLTLTGTAVDERAEKEERFEIQVRQVLRKYRPILDRITGVLAEAGTDPQEAEILLLWIAGTSHAMRGEAVSADLTMYTLARAWQYAAGRVAN